jgi:hypothetical protein
MKRKQKKEIHYYNWRTKHCSFVTDRIQQAENPIPWSSLAFRKKIRKKLKDG